MEPELPEEEPTRKPLTRYEGSGDSLEAALVDAAGKALDDNRTRNLGRQFVVTRHLVTIGNPHITEYVVEIGG